MKAIRVHGFGEPEVMKLEETAAPEPGPGQVLVRIQAAGVNPVDAYIRSGAYRPDLPLPYTPGIDGAGEVAAVGGGVESLSVGQRVYLTWAATGAYAEFALVAAAHVFPLPERISFAQGAALGVPYGTAWRALFQKAGARSGETVLVHGASGGVGIAAVQLAHQASLQVIGTAGSVAGEELVRQQGADHVVNHRGAGYQESIRRLTEGKGVEVILEMLANENLGRDLALLAGRGRIVVIGSRGTVTIDPRAAMSRDAAILGMSLFNILPQELAEAHAALGRGLESGALNPVISRELPLAEAAAAHRAVLAPGALGKIALLP